MTEKLASRGRSQQRSAADRPRARSLDPANGFTWIEPGELIKVTPAIFVDVDALEPFAGGEFAQRGDLPKAMRRPPRDQYQRELRRELGKLGRLISARYPLSSLFRHQE
ncbi:hypothetical protein CIT31_26995 [Mesorhizobium wenxiniae]|uniref:Uncharacterized protein n=1 Tax=Mesorhizobium wenxiniae TaxID=2014805 RepID=A0A271K9T6_9HYPH|nr:hypothetical protein CIT31_26995 [Mesorhizobium wenxiniae]